MFTTGKVEQKQEDRLRNGEHDQSELWEECMREW